MTFVLFDGQHGHEAQQALVVGEDADDVGAAADLAVEALQRVGGPQLGPVLGGQRVEGEHVVLGGLEHGRDLGELALERGHRF